MGNEEIVEQTEPIPEMRPGLEVGWIFRGGDAHAIERQGNRATVHSAPARDE
jgi:hypothetical protein